MNVLSLWLLTLAVAAPPTNGPPAATPVATAAAPPASDKSAAAAKADAPIDNDETTAVTITLETPDEQIKLELEEKLKSLDGAGLSDGETKEIRQLYQKALESFAVAVEQGKLAQDRQQDLGRLHDDLAVSKAKLEIPLKPFEDVTEKTLPEVEARAATADQYLAQYRDGLATCEAWLKRRTQRLAEIPAQIAAARQDLEELADARAAAKAVDEVKSETTELMGYARRMAGRLRRQALESRIRALELEQRYYQEAVDVYQLNRDQFDRLVTRSEKRVAQLREEINKRRERDAQQAQQVARQAAETAAAVRPPVIAKLAEANAQLAERRTKITADVTAATQEEAAARDRLSALQAEFKRARDQDQLKVLSDSVGQLLRQQQAKLPDLRELNRRRLQRDEQTSAVQLADYDLQDQRAELADIESLASRLALEAGGLSAEDEKELRTLLQAKVAYLDDLKKDNTNYLETLYKLGEVETALASETGNYANFIAERVLWIRSCSAPQAADVRPAARALAWSLDVDNWRAVGAALMITLREQPLATALSALALTLLAAIQPATRRRLALCGEEAAKRSCTKLAPTLEAVGFTAILVIAWPAAAALASLALDNPLGESEFVRALSVSLRFTAVCLLILEMVRRVCREGGLADAHFEWPRPRLTAVRRAVRWLTMVGMPLVLWCTGLEIQTVEPLASSTLGRAAFVAVMLLLAVVFWRLLMVAASPFRTSLSRNSSPWLAPLHWTWRPVVAASPLALAVLALAGYYYTAQQAALGLLKTVPLLLAVMTLGGVTRRWLVVNRRRLAREQARQRRAQLAAASSEGDLEGVAADILEDSVDLAALSEQTRKLVRTLLAVVTVAGLAVIWGDLLPALRYLGEHPLVPGVAAPTWGEALGFATVLALTYLSVRDIPALLELVVLQHLPLEGGVRYALTTLCRYILASIGISAAFHVIGVGWEHIQWLVAAMSVGLGFGLQEIFGNFVSGVILLFERPIRVGDIVTLGETTGVVSRIRMRATTIVDWDRKEYIVPNKDLVTQRLLNWTLSDNINRIVVKLAVAYGSDTDAACRLLVEAAREQPYVLSEPNPVAVFDGFGATGLALTLQCFLPNLEHRTETIHKLHTAINAKFKAAGIEIPAPSKETQVRLVREAPRDFQKRMRKTG